MIREWFSKVGQHWKGRKGSNRKAGDELLLIHNSNPVVPLRNGSAPETTLLKKKDSAEIVGEAVNKLVDRLDQINASISLQIQQHSQLVEKINQLPDILSTLPQQAQLQQQILQNLSVELKSRADSDQKILGAVAGLTEQAVEQTDRLGQINKQFQASEKVDQKLCDNMSNIDLALEKLDANTINQTQWIQQMSRSFIVTDRYIKYTLVRQQRRLMWVFIASISASLIAIAGLVLGIFFLTRHS